MSQNQMARIFIVNVIESIPNIFFQSEDNKESQESPQPNVDKSEEQLTHITMNMDKSKEGLIHI